MKKWFSTTVGMIWLLMGQVTNAQHNAVLKIQVQNEANAPVENASVLLTDTAGNGLIAAMLTDTSGHAQYNPAEGNYRIKVSSVAYGSYISEVLSLYADSTFTMNIKLTTASKDLKEVNVRAEKPLIEIQGDKVIMNVENSIVSAGGNVLEVLSRAPGVKVDQNDNISLKSRTGVTVMIDGQIIPLSAAELANMLKGMPAEAIDRIEIISNPSAKYDAAGTAGIINIRTKKDKRMGWNGTAILSYGQGVYPKTNTGLTLNYRDKRLTVYGGYYYAYRKSFTRVLLYRKFYDQGTTALSYEQDFNTVIPINTHTGNVGADYHLTDKTTIGAQLNATTLRYDPDGFYHSLTRDNTATMSTYFTTSNKSEERRKNGAVNLHLRHTFDTTGRELEINADAASYQSKSDQYFTTQYYNPSSQPPYRLYGNLSGLTTIKSLKADYTHPLRNELVLSAGIKASYVTADNEPLFYDQSNGGDRYDSTKSNHFIYSEQINAAYINGNKTAGKWTIQAGLRVEQTISKGRQVIFDQRFDRNYAQLFPDIAVQRKINEKHSLGLTFSRRIERPNYDQLNPFKLYLDPTEYDEGNPYLQPSISYNTELSHVFKDRFITTFSWSIISNSITEVVKTDETNSKITAQINVNLKRFSYYNLNLAYPFAITTWWNNITNLNAYYSHYEGSFASTMLNRGRPSLDMNITNSFTLPGDFTAQVTFTYQAPQVYAFMDMKSNWRLDAGLRKSLFGKRAVLQLNVTDIFWTSAIRGTSYYDGYTQSFITQRDTRKAALTFTYRLSKRPSESVQPGKGGAEDEKSRVGKAAG